jgi:penicillin-binding protein 1B
MPNRIEAIRKNPKSATKYRNNAARPVKSFKQKPPNLFRRIFRFVFNPITISLFVFFLLGVFLTLSYFWFEYSDRVDLLLRGEVFTRTAGIYSAPKNLRSGENISLEDLVYYLKSAGYIEKNQQADSSRSRYQITENALEIEPGNTALIDGKKTFHALAVKFKNDKKSGVSIASITDRDTKEEVKKTQLEPKMLSSIAAEGDGKRKTVAFNDLPKHLIKAITVTEDRAFFEHYGVNFRGIARALWRRYEGDENSPIARQGGSSITQQLVKNLLLSNDPTYERKMKDIYASFALRS